MAGPPSPLPAASTPAPDSAAHRRRARLRRRTGAAEILAITARDPHATLSSHEEAHPDRTPASGRSADPWHWPDTPGRVLASYVHCRGGGVDGIQCAVPRAPAAARAVSP